MAGDWIKFEHATTDKPEVFGISQLLGIDPDAVIGKLLRLWSWCDQQSVAGDLNISAPFLDRLTHQPGFAAALIEVGWMKATAQGLRIPNFDRHNGQTAKVRAESNRRIANHRARNGTAPEPCNGNVTEIPLHEGGLCNGKSVTNSLPKPLPEKRREEDRKREGKSAPSSEPETEPEQPPPAVRLSDIPKAEEVVAHGALIGVLEADCRAWHAERVSEGWADRSGLTIGNWRAFLRGWRDSRRTTPPTGARPEGLSTSDKILADKELGRVEARIKDISGSVDSHRELPPESRIERRKLKERAEVLRKQLGFSV